MIEAEITCICNKIRLPDIGLDLVKGQKAYIPLENAQASVDLERANQASGVMIRYVQRGLEQRKPPPVRAQHQVPVPSPRPAPPAIAPHPTLDLGALAKLVADELDRRDARLSDQIRQGLADIKAAVQTQQVQVVRVPASEGRVSEAVEDHTPTFIPERIVDPTVKADDIQVSKTESTGADVSDAAAALRAARKKR